MCHVKSEQPLIGTGEQIATEEASAPGVAGADIGGTEADPAKFQATKNWFLSCKATSVITIWPGDNHRGGCTRGQPFGNRNDYRNNKQKRGRSSQLSACATAADAPTAIFQRLSTRKVRDTTTSAISQHRRGIRGRGNNPVPQVT